jgi:aspartate/methionine/tyrosine aminotransferase
MARRQGGPVINMTIGEPKHKFPDWVGPALVEAMAGFNSYPDNNGTPELREAITGFLRRRYAIDLDMDSQVMVLNGTREGLFNAVVALGQTGSKILIPNPFYQVYTRLRPWRSARNRCICQRGQKVDFYRIWMH